MEVGRGLIILFKRYQTPSFSLSTILSQLVNVSVRILSRIAGHSFSRRLSFLPSVHHIHTTAPTMVHPNFKLEDPSLLLTTGWINDEGVAAASGKTFDIVDPADGEVWSKAPAMDENDTDKAIAAATEAFPTYSQISARQRARMILALDEQVRKHKEDLAQLLVMESGKALVEAQAEVDYASEFV